MTRNIASALALSSMALLAAACTASPPPSAEHVESREQALLRCRTPFTVLSGDTGTFTCESIAAVPPAPPYPSGALTSCDGTTAVAPTLTTPLAYAGCTYGRSIDASPRTDAFFLCPIGSTFPPPEEVGYRYDWVPVVDNGCFGASTDPEYAYVRYHWSQSMGTDPGGCGNNCNQPY